MLFLKQEHSNDSSPISALCEQLRHLFDRLRTDNQSVVIIATSYYLVCNVDFRAGLHHLSPLLAGMAVFEGNFTIRGPSATARVSILEQLLHDKHIESSRIHADLQ